MVLDRRIEFFHMPNSRSGGTFVLLEELKAPFDLHVRYGEQTREPAYLAINPMGKVPAIRHQGQLISEQGAIFIYLADLFPEAGLAPPIGDVLRGPYLRWLVYYGSSFEPAVIDFALKREAAPPRMCPYGDYDTMLKVVVDQLGKGPYLLGDRFSAADILWGTALGWTTSFKVVPELPEIMAYVERIAARPASQKIRAKDAELAAAGPVQPAS